MPPLHQLKEHNQGQVLALQEAKDSMMQTGLFLIQLYPRDSREASVTL